MDYNHLATVFRKRFQAEPRIFRSPGRINVIGEHTDYNEGLVLPAGIDKEIVLLMAPATGDHSAIFSVDTNEEVQFEEENYSSIGEQWARYPIGVYDQLVQMDKKPGNVNMLFTGNIPMGAGLSSSAALECVTAFAYNEVFELGINRKDLVKLSQRAENEFVGVNCGIMDQFASVFAKDNHVLRLDCRDLSLEMFPLRMKNYHFVLVDSMVTHSLASSEYNVRRAQCEEGVKVLKDHGLKVNSLRDVTMDQLNECREQMDDVVYRRCKYVIEEIARVYLACDVLQQDDLKKLGEYMYETHDGLSKEYEVSCPESDFLVDFTRDKPYVLGARQMGGGFGGCTLNIVHEEAIDRFREEIATAYEEAYGKPPEIYMVETSDGTSEVL